MSVAHRTLRGAKCPICIGRKVSVGVNDLETLNPELAAEWDTTKNKYSPSQFTTGSNEEIWWLCEKKHSWKTSIKTRTAKVGCPVCSNRTIVAGVNSLADTHPHLLEKWDYEKNVITPEEISYGSGTQVWWKCKEDHSFLSRPNSRTSRGTSCAKCSSTGISRKEQELASYIKGLLPEVGVFTSTKKVIHPLELDIYIPSMNVAFEFNGLYWHSEAQGKDGFYHFNKWKACKKLGIQLIQIWEDDWDLKGDLVRNMIAHKLGVSKDRTVYARSATFCEVSHDEASRFLEVNHLQGSRFARHVGLRDSSGVLVALLGMIVREGNVAEIARFASSCNIPGGFSKLLSGWLRLNPEIMTVQTYSHNDYSFGSVYSGNGFINVHEGSPGYSYVVGGERVNRLNFTKNKFKENPILQYDDGLSERELAGLNGLVRVWDSGSSLWEFKVPGR